MKSIGGYSLLALAIVLTNSSILFSADEIVTVDPTDGRLMNAQILGEWDTDDDLEDWTTSSVSSVSVEDGSFTGTGSAASACLSLSISDGPDLDFAFFDYLQFRMKVPSGFTGDIFIYYGTSENALTSTQKLTIPADSVQADDAWHIYRMYLGLEVFWRDTLDEIAFYPLGDSANGLEFVIDYFEVGDLPDDVYEINEDLNLLDDEEPTGYVESKHAVFWWSETSKDYGDWSDEEAMARRALRMIEESYPVYCKKLGYTDPWRDGYKVNFITWYSGYWEGDWNGYPHLNVTGDGLQDENWGNAVPHEFGHVVQSQQPGYLAGGHWESHVNFLRDSRTAHYAEILTDQASEIDLKIAELSNLRQDHGKLIYDDFRIHAALNAHAGDMGLSTTMVSDFWQETPTNMTVYAKLAQMLPSGYSVQDVVGYCLRYWPLLEMDNDGYRDVLWDTSDDKSLWYYITGSYLVPCADKSGWWRVPLARAPEKFAYMSHALTPTDTTVTVEFRGMDIYDSTEDWRWSLAAVDDDGNSRYSDVWEPGTESMELQADETKVYLIVVATPSDTSLNLDDYDNEAPIDKHVDRLRYPYEVRIVGATPQANTLDWTSTSGAAHANGGGWVASTATVAGTAYVGPNAKVLGSATVSNYAEIRDYAVVAGSAKVRGYAVVSGHALVQGSATVSGYARVRDRAIVEGSATVTNYAKVEECAHMETGGPTISGKAIVRGVSKPFDSAAISGTAIASHDYSMWFSNDDGVLFSHVPWGEYYEAYYSDTQAKPTGLIASYRFDQTDTGEICWDEFGDKHAFFRGSPTFEENSVMNGTVLALNGQDQYLVFDRDLCDSYVGGTYSLWVQPAELTAGMPLLFMGSAADTMITVTIADTDGHVQLSLNDGDTSSLTLTSSETLATNRWTNIAVTLNGSKAVLYLDGAASTEGSTTIRPEDVLAANDYSEPEAMYAGRDWDGNLYSGLLEDVRFYNLALTQAEIANEIERKGDCLGAFFMDEETEFDGSSDTCESGVHNGLERRLEADIYPHTSDDTDYYEAIFDCSDELGSSSVGSGIGIDNGYFKIKLDGRSSLWNTYTAATLNEWQHVALAFDGSTAKFYLDGELKASRSYSASADSLAGKNYRIGFAMDTSSNYYYFDGLIKNAKIYDQMEEASVTQPQVDINDDGIVDLLDLNDLLAYWLDTDATEDNNWNDGTDLNMDGKIDLDDFSMMAAQWLTEASDDDDDDEPTVVEGDFSQSYDFLANGTDGTGWDGMEGLGSATAVNSSLDYEGELYMESAGGYWTPGATMGPFLYKVVEGDFVASVKVTDYEGSADSYVYFNNAGLMVRASLDSDEAGTGEDWISLDYFPLYECGNMVRTADDGVRTDGVAQNSAGFDLSPYMQIERSGNTFYFRYSDDGESWTLLHTLTRSDFDGLSLQVGLSHATFTDTSGYVAFDDFVITQE